jgi:hypothetical protein
MLPRATELREPKDAEGAAGGLTGVTGGICPSVGVRGAGWAKRVPRASYGSPRAERRMRLSEPSILTPDTPSLAFLTGHGLSPRISDAA